MQAETNMASAVFHSSNLTSGSMQLPLQSRKSTKESEKMAVNTPMDDPTNIPVKGNVVWGLNVSGAQLRSTQSLKCFLFLSSFIDFLLAEMTFLVYLNYKN